MRTIIVNFLSVVIIILGSFALAESNTVYAKDSHNFYQAAMLMGGCDSESTPCACGFIACRDAGGSTDACWAGYEGCLGCSPDTTCIAG